MRLDLALVGGTVVLPEGAVAADIGIAGDRIAVLATPGLLGPAERQIEVTGRVVLPGLVDPHTHPGNFRPLDADVASETRSAAVGGVTTMLGTVKATRMPPDSPPVTTSADARSYLEVFPFALRAVEDHAHVDVGFSFIVMTRQHAEEIPESIRECGVTSYKFFLTYPPSTEWGARVGMPLFPDDGTVFLGFRNCAGHGALAMVHAENGQIIHALPPPSGDARTGLAAWEARFPGMLEATEIRRAADFARVTGAHYYAVHVSSLEGLAEVAAARANGARLTAETCPQYLVLDVESAAERGPLAKFNPPVRHPADADALWSAVGDGRIDTIGSDHVPNRRSSKIPDGTVENAIAGSPGVATLLPLVWTYGVQAGRIAPERLAQLISTGPARAFGLYPRKGAIRPGSDADLVVVDPATPRVVDASRLASWADLSAYEGMQLVGWPTLTVLRGAVVAEDGQPVGRPRGTYLFRRAESAKSGVGVARPDG